VRRIEEGDTNRVPRDRDVGGGRNPAQFPAGVHSSAGASIGLPDSRHGIPIGRAKPDPSHEFLHNVRSFRAEAHSHRSGIDIALPALPCAIPEDEEAL
jgi:hypothetical protein